MRIFTCILANCFNRLTFLAAVNTNCKKRTFLGNLRTITPEGNRETRQMTPFNSQNLFSWGPPFVPFWSVKYLNFAQKLPIRTAHHTFLQSRHPEITKNPHYVLSPEGNKKRYQLMDYRSYTTITISFT